MASVPNASGAAVGLELGAAGRSRTGLLSCLLVLQKLRIGLAIAVSGIAGMALAGQTWPQPMALAVFMISVLIAAGGAGAFNHYLDRDIDARMRRTAARPFASGRLQPTPLWPVLFFAQMLGGSLLAAWYFSWLCGAFVLAGALTYALVYTLWLKRRNDWNIVIGGAAGSWAVLAGAAAVTGEFSAEVLALALVLFLWTPSHFWSLAIALEDDYRRAGVPMLPVTRGRGVAVRWNLINTVLLFASSLFLAALVDHALVWLGAVVGGGWLLWTTLAMRADPEPKRAMTSFRASLVQLALLLVALLVVSAWP